MLIEFITKEKRDFFYFTKYLKVESYNKAYRLEVLVGVWSHESEWVKLKVSGPIKIIGGIKVVAWRVTIKQGK